MRGFGLYLLPPLFLFNQFAKRLGSDMIPCAPVMFHQTHLRFLLDGFPIRPTEA